MPAAGDAYLAPRTFGIGLAAPDEHDDQIHPSGVQCACFSRESVQLDRRNPGERVSFASLLLQPIEAGNKLLDSLDGRLARLSFHPVPNRYGCV